MKISWFVSLKNALILAVFENFKEMCLKIYHLDHVHFL